jgi:hypothetical protein
MDNLDISLNEIDKLLNDTSLVEVEKKKRGRKPKNSINLENDLSVGIDTTTDIQPDKIKKRGRKSGTKIINLDSNTVEMPLSNLIIAYLPLKDNDIVKVTNNPIEKSKNTKFFDINDDNLNLNFNTKTKNSGYCQNCKNYELQIKRLEGNINKLKNGIIESSLSYSKKVYDSNASFYNKNTHEWNEQTDIACWWCCHQFNTIPLGIPEYIYKNTYYLFGCFCSFNCMMAYNIDINDYKIWNRQTNIYQMKNKLDPENKLIIKPAPPRQTLKLFGGPLTIEEYRESFFVINRQFRYYLPTMISITGIIEEENQNTSINNDIKINKHSNQPQLRRKKPLPNQAFGLNNILEMDN